MIFKVTANSKKGKSRIKEHGDTWELTQTKMNVLFDTKSGPWVSLKSVETGCERWVHARDDAHFVISSLKTRVNLVINQ